MAGNRVRGEHQEISADDAPWVAGFQTGFGTARTATPDSLSPCSKKAAWYGTFDFH